MHLSSLSMLPLLQQYLQQNVWIWIWIHTLQRPLLVTVALGHEKCSVTVQVGVQGLFKTNKNKTWLKLVLKKNLHLAACVWEAAPWSILPTADENVVSQSAASDHTVFHSFQLGPVSNRSYKVRTVFEGLWKFRKNGISFSRPWKSVKTLSGICESLWILWSSGL